MNQILVTDKIYITPELKRKKKMYKLRFCMSIFAICMLFSYYIYAEYDKDKSEAVSKDILSQLNSETKNIEQVVDSTTRNIVNDVLIIALDVEPVAIQEEPELSEPLIEEQTSSNAPAYTSDDANDYESESILSIPTIDIEYPVLKDTSEELLKISLNKYWGPKPNQVGNYCIVGHNYKNGKMFGKLSRVEIGDLVTLTDKTIENGKTVTYEVYDKYVISPDDMACTSQLTHGNIELTLITCTNYGTQRLVVKCRKI